MVCIKLLFVALKWLNANTMYGTIGVKSFELGLNQTFVFQHVQLITSCVYSVYDACWGVDAEATILDFVRSIDLAVKFAMQT